MRLPFNASKRFLIMILLMNIVKELMIYHKQQLEKEHIKKPQSPSSTYFNVNFNFNFNKYGLKRSDIVSYLGALAFMGTNKRPKIDSYGSTDPFINQVRIFR